MAGDTASVANELRARNKPVQAESQSSAKSAVLQLNTGDDDDSKLKENKKTYGRTPDGTVFLVPVTTDMVSQLLSPTEPKNVSDLLVVAVISAQISLLWLLPDAVKVSILACVFIFWRSCYNMGIGWLLYKQSKQQTLIRWARKTTLFGPAEECIHPKLRAFVKSELEKKITKDYSFDTAPLEYNTWLSFRRIVDLILMCDFTSYILFAVACASRPSGEGFFITAARWVTGLILVAFNLWVKLDAHRVVQDYAWYWGDFFFLVDQQLTFDGVFEMAPHPMYSIGYIGYYGISLIAASHKVMFISILAHAAQFAFLVLVENPHIEKTYNPPPPRTQLLETSLESAEGAEPQAPKTDTATSRRSPPKKLPSATHDLLGPQNFDLYRVTDVATVLIQILMLVLTFSTPNSVLWKTIFILSAIVCRLWFSFGIGFLLDRQSTKKKWTRHFLKFGESADEAWRQWKGTYHISMIMCYSTLLAAVWKMYEMPASWHSITILKHTIGSLLICLQLWTAFSIYEQLGEFGWFFGDFFFDHSPKLTYSGIYRFLNNPERVLGLAGVWGLALITNSPPIFCLALLSHISSLLFLYFVERPHMQKLYGRHIREDAGFLTAIKRSLPPPLRRWQDRIDGQMEAMFDAVEEYLDVAKPRLVMSVTNAIRPTRELFEKYPATVIITRTEPISTQLDPAGYSIEILRLSENKSEDSILSISYGESIKIKWTAPATHNKLDWIGLYMTKRVPNRAVTQVSSQGRWVATNRGEYDVATSEDGIVSSDVNAPPDGTRADGLVSGEMVFKGNKLWWQQGVFEFRYHHNGKHNVMAVSAPFEISINRFSDDDLDAFTSYSHPHSQNEDTIRHAISRALLPVVCACFDNDPNVAPSTVQESFGALVERDGRYSKRVVYAIQQMFGIEFAPQVVKADGKVNNLAWRIWEAKKVLAPFSMSGSRSRGTDTPVEREAN